MSNKIQTKPIVDIVDYRTNTIWTRITSLSLSSRVISVSSPEAILINKQTKLKAAERFKKDKDIDAAIQHLQNLVDNY